MVKEIWNKLTDSIAFYVGLLFVFLLIIRGHPVPEPITEYLYIPCLVKQFNPEYLANDWTLSSPFYEHYVFNVTFGWLTLFMPMEAVGWLGRILCWLLISLALLRLGQRFGIPLWMAFLGILFWLLKEQSIVASSWMVGGFEAKVVAYIFLVVAFNLFIQKRYHLASFLLGLCFSFHPAVGLWGGLAVGFALLLYRTHYKKLAAMAGLVILGALPGLIATSILLSKGGTSSMEVWKFVVLIQSPQHLDPASWPLRETMLVYLLFFFNVLSALTFRENHTIRFLVYVQLGLGLFFTLGLGLRWTGSYTLLKYFPFRVFPLLVPLCFLWQVMHAIHHYGQKKLSSFALIVGMVGLLSFGSPLGQFMDYLRETIKLNRPQNADRHKVMRWLAQNTPKKSVVIQPPWWGETFYLSQRAQIANWWANRYDKLPEWKARLESMVGTIPPSKAEEKVALLEKNYNARTPQQIRHIVKTYGAHFLVSKGNYAYPKLFETKTYRVYDLRKMK